MANEAHCQSPVPGNVAFRLAVVLLQSRLYLISVTIAGVFLIHGFVIYQSIAPNKRKLYECFQHLETKSYSLPIHLFNLSNILYERPFTEPVE